MLTGCRPSEAIGLQRKHIDYDRKEILIESSLSRSKDPTHPTRRIRKETKTGSTRILPMNTQLFNLLQFAKNYESAQLIFTTKNGLPFDDKNFCNRQWRKCLKELNIEYRPPYTLRHTFASRCIEAGVTMPQLAYLMGHKDTRMVMSCYGHMINKPELPEL